MHWLEFVAGFVIGGIFGIAYMAVMAIAGRGDEREDQFINYSGVIRNGETEQVHEYKI